MIILADYIPISSTHSATALGASATTLSVHADADAVILQAQEYSVLLTLDGTTPNAGSSPVVGFRLRSTDPPLRIPWQTGMTLKVIRETDGAVLQKVDVRANA